MKIKIYLLVLVLFAAFLFGAKSTEAATMYLLPDERSLSIGQEFSMDLKIDSGTSTSINSAQATIQFPTGVLSGASTDKQNSIFGFWLEEPTISSDNGTIHFVGGTTKGVSGSALHVLRMKFKASGAGSAELKIIDAAVTASDGKGTNVLSEVKGTSVVVGTNVAAPPPLPAQATEQPKAAEQPKKVERAAVKATGLPAKPVLRVPLYPDPSRWYSQLGDTIVLWDIPPDIVQVASRLSHSQDNKLGEPEKELLTGKNFGALQEGMWYIKVQFRNNVGWSDPSYYKISIDTTPPLPFEIKIDNAVSDNPSPAIQYETNDSLSGIAGYSIFIDGKGPTETTSTMMKLPPQAPGKHTLTVKAADLAGNSVQASLDFEVLPLPTPKIEFITNSVPQGDFVFVSGKGVPGGSVEVSAINDRDQEVFRGTTPADSAGHWDITVKEPLAIGSYKLSAIAHDDRGASSLPSDSVSFRIKAKTILSLGFIELGWFEILIFAILIVGVGTGFAGWYYVSVKKTREAYRIIVGRDIDKLSTLLSGYLKELEDLRELHDPSRSAKTAALEDKMKEVIAKMNKYLGQEVEKLK